VGDRITWCFRHSIWLDCAVSAGRHDAVAGAAFCCIHLGRRRVRDRQRCEAARQHERWGFLLFEGIIDIITAAVAFLWPGITVVAFVLLVAVWAILTGAMMLAAAFRLDIDDGRWWLVFAGLVSLIYGVLLVVAPMIGAVVLTWWLGAYALVFGVSLLVLGFRLRARQDKQLSGETA
jgi:hypothetical protein